MPLKRTHIAIGLAAGTTAFAVPAVPAAQAGLLGGLTNTLGQLVNTVGSTVGGALPGGLGSTVEGVTGTVGGVVTGLGTTVDQTLEGVTGGETALDTGLLNGLLGTVLGTTNGVVNTPGATSGGSTGGVVGGGGTTPGSNVIDARPPQVTYTVLSKLRGVQGTGRFKLRVKTDEPGVVILSGKLTPGKKLARSRASKSRASIKIPAVVLGYRKAGSLNVKFQLSKAARKRLGSVRNAKLTLETVASDAFKNQERDRVSRTVKR